MGKFGKFTKAPRRPYHPSLTDIGKEGNSTLLEIPWAIFPWLKLPAGSGIMHRVAGNLYNTIAIHSSLSKGHTSYYFHPYEINNVEIPKHLKVGFKIKIFLRKVGSPYYSALTEFLTKNRHHLINGINLYNHLKS